VLNGLPEDGLVGEDGRGWKPNDAASPPSGVRELPNSDSLAADADPEARCPSTRASSAAVSPRTPGCCVVVVVS